MSTERGDRREVIATPVAGSGDGANIPLRMMNDDWYRQ